MRRQVGIAVGLKQDANVDNRHYHNFALFIRRKPHKPLGEPSPDFGPWCCLATEGSPYTLAFCDDKLSPMRNIDGIIQELQQERARIDQAIRALTSSNGSAANVSPKRTMSASARRRIAAAQRARWAKQKGTRTATATARPKRRISAAGIARIRAASKARWAKVRAAAKK